MDYRLFRDWPRSRPEAFSFVSDLAPRILFEPLCDEPTTIAAVDTAYGVGGAILYAAAVVLSFPDNVELERSFHHGTVSFPYVPGLYFFREGPVIIEALAKLQTSVDLIMLNGHGLAHPRFCGLACHIGYIFDLPAIGCARRLLAGVHGPVGDKIGSTQPILMADREVGLVYRSREKVKPIFISPGHKCDLTSARDMVAGSLHEYRLPEPLRVAHMLANRYRQRSERDTAELASEIENE
jgi:deoxyribonuclease V